MLQNQINMSPIIKFIQLVRAAELNKQVNIQITMQQARLISLTLNEMMSKLLSNQDEVISTIKNNTGVVSVNMDGGKFGD
jgi:hypothetical protein